MSFVIPAWLKYYGHKGKGYATEVVITPRSCHQIDLKDALDEA
jgi:hypothetical protein